MELGSRPTIWLVAKGEGAVAPVVAARAAAVVVQVKWVAAAANAIKAAAKVAERWVAVALAVKVGQVVAAKVAGKWAAAEK